MTHVCDAYKTKWDGNNFLKRGHTLLTQTSHQAIYKWETVVKEKKRGWLKKPNFYRGVIDRYAVAYVQPYPPSAKGKRRRAGEGTATRRLHMLPKCDGGWQSNESRQHEKLSKTPGCGCHQCDFYLQKTERLRALLLVNRYFYQRVTTELNL